MAVRLLLAAGLIIALTGCGQDQAPAKEVRILAPADLVEDVSSFERSTGCRADVRVYDAGEDLDAIARRRDVDVVAAPVSPGTDAHDSVALVRIELEPGLDVTVPARFATAFGKPARPAGRRTTRWEIRNEGDNPDCARRWVAYATSQ